jgi:hypothetical protein
MVGWPRRRGWEYREELAVPADLDLHGLEVTRAFLHRTVRGNRSMLRRTVPINIERVTVEVTGRASFECRALPRALAVVEPPDEVEAVHLEILTGRGDDTVVLDWRAGGTSCGEVRGRSRTWVLGVHGVLQRFFDQRGFGVAEPVPARRHGRHRRGRSGRWGRLPGVSIEVVVGVVSSAVFALLSALWAHLT